MKSTEVAGREAEDIKNLVSKIIRGLGSPEPPLNLEHVRELLRLDRHYYRSTDTGLINEFISRMRIGTKQFLARPTLLIDAIRKFELSALWIPDSRRIMVDKAVPKLKWRWNETHEIGHSIIPWHAPFLHGDTQTTLNLKCHEIIEAEANYAAGQLLFLQDRFIDDSRSLPATIESVKQLAADYGNTITSTLWRFIEETSEKPMVAIVSQHPKRPKPDFDPLQPCKYFIPSPTFRHHFGKVTELQLFAGIKDYCSYRSGGHLGNGEVRLADDRGAFHIFEFESFFNRYEALTLGSYKSQCRTAVAVL
jgi:hypothetical protein